MVIYLVDDTELFHAPFETELRTQLSSMQLEADIRSFSDASSFLRQVRTLPPDICFLDIILDKDRCNGLDLAEQLRGMAPRCRIIFLTSYLQYVTSSFDVRPTYYILKSEFRERLPAALKLAIQCLSPAPPSSICLTVQRKQLTLATDSILYFERIQRETKVVCEDQVLLTRENLSSLADRLNDSFSRCHSGFLVNLTHVATMRSRFFYLNNGVKIPISRSKYADVQCCFTRFLAAHIMKEDFQ